MLKQNVILLSTIKKYRVWIIIGKLIMAVSVWLLLSNPNPGSFVMEIWKDIRGWEGFYQVSNLGNVKSFERIIMLYNYRAKRKVPVLCRGRILKPGLNTQGYHFVVLQNLGNKKTYRVSRLVALHFIPNPQDKPQINHKDGEKLNNRSDNLEWVTPSENLQHAYDTGLRSHLVGEKAPNNKITEENVLRIKGLKGIKKQTDIAKEYGISRQHISRIWNNRTWKHLANEK